MRSEGEAAPPFRTRRESFPRKLAAELTRKRTTQRLQLLAQNGSNKDKNKQNTLGGKLRDTAACRLGLVGGVAFAITTNNRNLNIFMPRPW